MALGWAPNTRSPSPLPPQFRASIVSRFDKRHGSIKNWIKRPGARMPMTAMISPVVEHHNGLSQMVAAGGIPATEGVGPRHCRARVPKPGGLLCFAGFPAAISGLVAMLIA